MFNEENVFFAPALPLEEVFDPTGAGDTFAGGFAGFLTKTNDFSFENIKKAVIYGSRSVGGYMKIKAKSKSSFFIIKLDYTINIRNINLTYLRGLEIA